MSKKTALRYKELRDKMLSTFKNYEGSGAFRSVFASMDNINHIVLDSCCDDGKVLCYDKATPANVLFQILRIAQRPIIFRELCQATPIIFKSHTSLVEAFAILYSLDLIDYKIRDGYEGPLNSLIVFIKEEDLNPYQPL